MAGSLTSVNNNVMWALSQHTQALATLQEQAATGLRINRISDDPSDSHRILDLQSQQRQKESYLSSLNDVVSFLEIASGVIQNMSDKATSAREQLTSIMSAIHSQSQETKASAAEGIDMILEDMLSMANWQHQGQWLFGGANSTITPYSTERVDGKITRVTYQGSLSARQVEVNNNLEVGMNTVGQDVFSLDNRSAPTFFGSTGAAAGTATSTVTGDVWLEIETTGGGYNLSIDGGASWTTVAVPPGQANSAITHSETGQILYVDTTSITQAGLEPVRAKGTHDMFNLLVGIRDLLLNTNNLSLDQQDELLQAAVADFQTIHQKLTQGLTALGSKLGSLDGIKQSLEDAKLNAEEDIALLGDADIAQLSVDLARRETLYQMSIAVAAKLFSMSILDYM